MAQAKVQYKRVYVNVEVNFDSTGRMLPRALIWSDGKKYDIDRVLDIRPAYAEKAGGQGDRYKIKVRGADRELFFEHSADLSSPIVGRWFVEGRA